MLSPVDKIFASKYLHGDFGHYGLLKTNKPVYLEFRIFGVDPSSSSKFQPFRHLTQGSVHMACFWPSGHWLILLREGEVILILIKSFLVVCLNMF